MSYYSKKLAVIRDCLEHNIYPPTYDPEKWNLIRFANCYAYSLDIPVSDPREHIWLPGSIFDERKYKEPIFSELELLDRVYSDLKFLNILFRENNETINENEYRIAIYLIPTYYAGPKKFHFSRQDKDGGWSEKPTRNKKIRLIDNNSDKQLYRSRYLVKTLVLSKIK